MENGNVSDSIPVSSSPKQGCVLAPTLVSFFFLAVLVEAFCWHWERNIYLVLYQWKVSPSAALLIRDLLFSNDLKLAASAGEGVCLSSGHAEQPGKRVSWLNNRMCMSIQFLLLSSLGELCWLVRVLSQQLPVRRAMARLCLLAVVTPLQNNAVQ